MQLVRSVSKILWLGLFLQCATVTASDQPVIVFDQHDANVESAESLDSLSLAVALEQALPAQIHLCRSSAEQWHVTAISYEGSSIGDRECRSLAAIHSLEELSLIGTLVTDEGLASLRELKRLRYLDLRGARISSAGLRAISHLQQLQVLDVRGTELQSAELTELQLCFPTTEIFSDWGNTMAIDLSQLAEERGE